MEYTKCRLFNVVSKKSLCQILKIPNKEYYKQEYLSQKYNVYIDHTGRIIESPAEDLKKIQAKIKNHLSYIQVPDYVFSGIKKRSYYDNAGMHKGNPYVFKIDLTAFFPSISRDVVYRFFREDLMTSPDVAEILTNLTTIDLTLCNIKKPETVEAFLLRKQVRTTNHLISGAPTSQILSYLTNHTMFDELHELCMKYHVIMTVYVDDITFSSNHRIPYWFRDSIINIIKKNQYRLSKAKVKLYSKNYPKLITGVVIGPKGNIIIRNSLRYKIKMEFQEIKEHPEKSRERLQGLIAALRQTAPGKYPNAYIFAYSKQRKNQCDDLAL